MFDKENNNENKDKKNRILRRTLKILKWACITFVSIIVLSLIIRAIGVSNNNKVPDGGINESMYITINKSKQWINIYGQNINNPVILYLHGGPGAATSLIDYKFLRKWSDIYTIVTWDQRNTGLSYSDDQNNTEITYDMLMEDGVEVTKFIMSYLNKDKITLIGHSWGTYYGSNLSLKHPEFYDYYIGTGQLVDAHQTEEALIKAAKEWSKGDPEGEKLISKMDANNLDPEYFKIRAKIMDRYKEYQGNDEPDYNVLGAVFFNPYYSIIDTFKFLFGGFDQKVYEDFTKSPELDKFSLLNQTEYKIPYYNILGDHDYDTNHFQAEDYFNAIKAPRKKLYIMKDMGHGTFSVRSGEFSDIMHEIAKLEQNEQHNNINNNTTTTATTTTNNNNSSNNSTVAINNNNNSSNNSTVTINNNNNNNKNNSTITIN